MVKVEVVYVAGDKSTLHMTLDLEQGSTVIDALNQSGIYQTHPETKNCSVGIFAKIVTLDTILKEGDRVELYRSLARDPKEKRRQQARLKK